MTQVAAPFQPAVKTAEKQSALAWIAANQAQLSKDHAHLWDLAEPSWREYRSAAWFVDRLRQAGFTVEEGSAGMPTAFCATWGTEGPVLGGYAEYDAVPGMCQAPIAKRQPRDGFSPHAAGHTDPHSALGLGALAGFLAAKAAFEKHGIKARLKFFGEPAEKMCGSKPVHAAHGYYDNLDVAISFHPSSLPALANTTVWDTHCGAYWSKVYTFECPSPETWMSAMAREGANNSHSSARAPGALDAVCLMYTTSKYTKENMLPHTGGWTMNEAILVAGQATADNIAPHVGQIQYSLRAATVVMQEKAFAVLDNNADAVAQITHCTVSKDWITKTRPGLPNHALAEITYRNLAMVGAPQFSEDAKEFARALQREVGIEPMAEPFLPALSELIDPREGEAALRASLPPWQKNFTSDDYVEYTWHCPTVRLYVGRAQLNPPQPGYFYPEWTRSAMGGVPACIDPLHDTAAKAIAATLVELATDPAAIPRCRKEFAERTGGGIGGTAWAPPLLPKDFRAPIDYRWPEYVTTPRGFEWTLPTPTR